ncbi:hypothetical protein [Pseudoxanthomonas beigongshangi]
MSGTYSLLISPEHADLVQGDAGVDPGTGFRLVHEQLQKATGSRWYFYADPSLSKPEALRRAQQWYDSSGHPDWPGLAERA